MTSEELARYSRQIILPGFGVEAQEKLSQARVLVVGMGGLGSPVSLYLAAAGVGALGLCDFDVVELHNLHRQILHGTNDIERRKTKSAADRLRALNPHVSLEIHGSGVRVDNARDLFAQYDVIVDGSDNFPVRYLDNDTAFLAGRPLIYGSIFQFEGQVTVFHPNSGGPCYRCLFPQMPDPGTVPNCAEAGVVGALPGVIGSLQAMETVKWITGLGDPLIGTMLTYNALDCSFRRVKLKPDPDCPLCGEHPSIRALEPAAYDWNCIADEPDPAAAQGRSHGGPHRGVADEPDPAAAETAAATGVAYSGFPPEEVDVETVRQRLADQGSPPSLLDVREDFERRICKIEGSISIPLGSIPQRWRELDREVPLIVYCHHGMRSLRATRFLRERGFSKVQNMAGGINRWAEQIEPGMQRY